MIAVETWQIFGGLIGILVLLGGGALSLQRLGIIQTKSSPATAQAKGDAADISLAVEVGAVRQQYKMLQESVAMQEERLRGMERELAALDERTKNSTEALNKIGRLHARIDDISRSVHEQKGLVESMQATQNRIDEFLRQQSVLRT